MAGARLPFELCVLLAPALRRPLHIIPALPTRRHIAIAADLVTRPITSFTSSPTPPSLFEEDETPYHTIVPRSTVKWNCGPKSNDEALLSLLLDNRLDEADLLLRDLRASSQRIIARQSFARYAYRLFRKDIHSNWLDWWSVGYPTPPEDLSHWSQEYQGAAAIVLKVCKSLVAHDPTDFARMLDYAVVAVAQGFEPQVWNSFLLHFAAYAPMEMNERLWTCIGTSLDRRERRNENNWKGIVREAKTKGIKLTAERSACHHALIRTQTHRYSQLRARQNEAIRIHVGFNRLETATRLAQTSGCRPDTKTILILLSATANGARYELFKRIYALLPQEGFALVPRDDGLAGQPFRIDKRDRPSPDPHDAYVTLRYGSFTSPLEEGPTESSPPSSNHNQAVNTDFFAALTAKDRQTASRILLNAFKPFGHSSYPSLDSVARLIAMLREEGFGNVIQQISRTVMLTSEAWPRGYWATALMLEHVRSGNSVEAVKTMVTSFQLAGLPALFRDAFKALAERDTPTKRTGGRTTSRKLLLSGKSKVFQDSHSFSIGMEALVTALSKQKNSQAIDDLYRALVHDASRFNLLARGDASKVLEDDTPRLQPKTSLNRYTFLPFLRHFAQDWDRPPSALLSVLRDMVSLNLVPAKQHWGVVVACYARRGSLEDLRYLLDWLEDRDTSFASNPSEEMMQILEGILSPKQKPDVVVYTSVVTGLTLREEARMAKEVADWSKAEPRLKGSLDQKFWESVRKLEHHTP